MVNTFGCPSTPVIKPRHPWEWWGQRWMLPEPPWEYTWFGPFYFVLEMRPNKESKP